MTDKATVGELIEFLQQFDTDTEVDVITPTEENVPTEEGLDLDKHGNWDYDILTGPGRKILTLGESC